jgi:hypothetical protein
LFQRCVARPPDVRELEQIRNFFEAQKKHFAATQPDAAALAAAETSDKTELATWTTVARAVLNLDETITRE